MLIPHYGFLFSAKKGHSTLHCTTLLMSILHCIVVWGRRQWLPLSAVSSASLQPNMGRNYLCCTLYNSIALHSLLQYMVLPCTVLYAVLYCSVFSFDLLCFVFPGIVLYQDTCPTKNLTIY